MRRRLLVGLMSIALLFGAAVWMVVWVTSGPEPVTAPAVATAPRPAATPEPVAAATPPSNGLTRAPALLPAPGPGLPDASPSPSADVSAAAAPRSKTEERAIAASIKRPPHRQLRGSAAPTDLFQGLAELQQRVRHCADDGVSRTGRTVAQAAPSTVLLLEFETLPGKVAIVGAPVKSRGGASDRLIACVQGDLLGQEIAAAMAEPGARFELPFALAF